MSDGTKIEWADATWNVVNGCTVVSPGCAHCYAMKQAHRFPVRQGLTRQSPSGMTWTGEVRFNEAVLTQPLRWKRPRRIFVCAHGDLFHDKVPDEWIDQVFAVMALASQHTFQVLTKRPERMRDYMTKAPGRIADTIIKMRRERGDNGVVVPLPHIKPGAQWWPLPNVWLGTSVEDQQRADERIPILLDTPAAVRWISAEPLLGLVDLHLYLKRWTFPSHIDREGQGHWPSGLIDWVVAGGESGPGSRPMESVWARYLRDQCGHAQVAFLFKQWGEWWPLDQAAQEWGVTVDQARDMFLRAVTATHAKIGKAKAGRLLDGVQHDGYPEVAA